MDIMVIYRGHGRKGSGWFVILITSMFLKYTKFPFRSDRESVIMNDVYPSPCLEEARRDNWALDEVLIGWMTGIGGGIFSENGSDISVNGYDCLMNGKGRWEWGWDATGGCYL